MPAFCCTGEPKRQPGSFKKVHERPWELDVQSAVRSRRPPYQPPLFMIVGLDGEGIAAAAIYEELDGPAVVQVQFMAVALRCRGRGGGTADEMFGEILRRLEERAMQRRVDQVLVTGSIYGLNVPSQRMAFRAGMRHVDTFSTGVQEWQMRFEVARVGDEAELP